MSERQVFWSRSTQRTLPGFPRMLTLRIRAETVSVLLYREALPTRPLVFFIEPTPRKAGMSSGSTTISSKKSHNPPLIPKYEKNIFDNGFTVKSQFMRTRKPILRYEQGIQTLRRTTKRPTRKNRKNGDWQYDSGSSRKDARNFEQIITTLFYIKTALSQFWKERFL